MTIFLAMLLTILSFGFIFYPLFRQRLRPADSAPNDKLRGLYSQRDTTYAMLKELEFDFQSGILTEEDYRDLETRYKRKAISALKDIDSVAPGGDGVDDIEKKVRELRREKARSRPQVSPKAKKETTIEAEIEREVLQLRQPQGQFCRQCGARHEAGDRFCAQCGAHLK